MGVSKSNKVDRHHFPYIPHFQFSKKDPIHTSQKLIHTNEDKYISSLIFCVHNTVEHGFGWDGCALLGLPLKSLQYTIFFQQGWCSFITWAQNVKKWRFIFLICLNQLLNSVSTLTIFKGRPHTTQK